MTEEQKRNEVRDKLSLIILKELIKKGIIT